MNQIIFKAEVADSSGEMKSVQLLLRHTHPLFSSIEESLKSKCLTSSSYHPEGASILIKQLDPVNE